MELVRYVVKKLNNACRPFVGTFTDSATAINLTDRSYCVFVRSRFEFFKSAYTNLRCVLWVITNMLVIFNLRLNIVSNNPVAINSN
jgi:hypothetical protein